MNRLYQWDTDLCIQFNRISSYRILELVFHAVSRLGNGMFWYGLMVALPVIYGHAGWRASAHMLFAAVPALLIYRLLKQGTSRQRPCRIHPRVRQKTATLDQYSFPSGHTLHAVNFTLVAGGHFPELAGALTGFTVLVALSRPVLGLHYPSDVLAGAMLGALVAGATWQSALFG